MNFNQFILSRRDEYRQRIERAQNSLGRLRNQDGRAGRACRRMIATCTDMLSILDRHSGEQQHE